MQVKKEQVREDLLVAALNEFLAVGYEKASLRRIVKQAKTTTGNFYNYFENKETLFDTLVTPAFLVFKWLLDHREAMDKPYDLIETQHVEQFRSKLLCDLKKWVPELDKGFILLFKKSEGTRYAFFKDAFLDMLSDYFLEHIEKYNPSYPYKEISKTLSKQVVDGFIDILEMHYDSETKHHLMTEHLLVIGLGVQQLIVS